MLDLSNLPNPTDFKLQEFPGVNEALIEEKVKEGNIRYLVDLLSFFRRGQLRAEMLAQVYFNQMESDKQRHKESQGLDLPTKREPRQTHPAKVVEEEAGIDL